MTIPMSFRIPDETQQQLSELGDNMTATIVRAVNLLWTLTATDEVLVATFGTVEQRDVPSYVPWRTERLWAFTPHKATWQIAIPALPETVQTYEDAIRIYAKQFRDNRVNAILN